MDVLRGSHIEAPGGLAGNHDCGFARQLSGQHDLLQVSSAEALGLGMRASGLNVIGPDQFLAEALNLLEIQQASPLELGRNMVFQNQVLFHRQVHEEAGLYSVLGDSPHSQADRGHRASQPEGTAFHFHRSSGGFPDPEKNLGQFSLAVS